MLVNIFYPYQCGFWPHKSAIDQIFTLRQILEKTQELKIDTYHLSVDYKAAFDTPIRRKLFEATSAYKLKLKSVCTVILNYMISSSRSHLQEVLARVQLSV